MKRATKMRIHKVAREWGFVCSGLVDGEWVQLFSDDNLDDVMFWGIREASFYNIPLVFGGESA